MPPKPPTKEKLLFAAITEGNEAEVIRLIEEGASLTKTGPGNMNPLRYSLYVKKWNVFDALINKGAKFICGDFHYLINNLANAVPVNVAPILTVFHKSPDYFLKCNQNSSESDSLWYDVFSGSEEFIKAFINIVKEKNRTALVKPESVKMPLLIALLADGDEAAIVAGAKHLIAAAGINMASPKNKENPITALILGESSIEKVFTVRFLKRCQAVGYNINAKIYGFGNPNYKDILLEELLKTTGEAFNYEDMLEPVRTDPETDVLSYLLDNTPRFITHYHEFISEELLEMRPQIMLRLLMKLNSINIAGLEGILAAPGGAIRAKAIIKKYMLKQAASGNLYTINEIVKLWPGVINAKLNNNIYTDLVYSFLLHDATKYRELNMVRRLLELGADPKLVDSNGVNPCQYAPGSSKIEELVCPPKEPEKPSAPWAGLSRSNVQKYNYIFEANRGTNPRAVAENHSFCPICLTDAERTIACNHMQHNCSKDNPDRYHKELYDRFKDPIGNVHWCTLCGRICTGFVDGNDHAFIHYNLASAADAAAGKATLFNPSGRDIQGDPYTHDCSLTVYDSGDRKGEAIPVSDQSGGGGLREKFLRIHRLRQFAYALKETNEKTAYKRLIEQTWNAPLVGTLMNRPELENIKGPNTWNIPTSAFRLNVEASANDPRPKPPAAHYADLKRSACDAEATLIVSDGMNATSLNNINAENKGCQFRHMEEDSEGKTTGHMMLHEDSPFLISTVKSRIADYVQNFAADYFGKCIDTSICKARIFPEDLVPLLGHGFPQELYEQYRELFNWRFGGARLAEGIKPGGEPGPAVALVQVLQRVNNNNNMGANAAANAGINAANIAAIQAAFNEVNQAGGRRTRKRRNRRNRKTRRLTLKRLALRRLALRR